MNANVMAEYGLEVYRAPIGNVDDISNLGRGNYVIRPADLMATLEASVKAARGKAGKR